MVVAPTTAQLTTVNTIFSADSPAFRQVDLSTKRRSFDTSIGFSFDPQWELLASWRRDHKDGLRAQGAINDALNGNSAVILPTLVDETTDHYNLSMRFTGDRGFAHPAYYSSSHHTQHPTTP